MGSGNRVIRLDAGHEKHQNNPPDKCRNRWTADFRPGSGMTQPIQNTSVPASFFRVQFNTQTPNNSFVVITTSNTHPTPFDRSPTKLQKRQQQQKSSQNSSIIASKTIQRILRINRGTNR